MKSLLFKCIEFTKCEACNGTSKIQDDISFVDDGAIGFINREVTCPKCNGIGGNAIEKTITIKEILNHIISKL